MLTQINIKRVDDTHVTFDTVSINNTDNVFFTNLDTGGAVRRRMRGRENIWFDETLRRRRTI